MAGTFSLSEPTIDPPLKVNRWLGEGLRQWRGSSQTSSVIPHIVATDGIPCGGGAVRPPSTAPPMWLTSSGGGGGRGWPQRWSTLWATLTLRWLGLWCFHGLLVARLLMSVWLCCWPPCGVTPCMYSPERKSTKATMEISVPVPAGPVVSLPDMDVATNRKEVDDVGCDSDSSSVPSESSDSDVSTASARNITTGPSPSAGPGERPRQFTPGSKPQVVGSGRRKLRSKGAGKAPRGGAAEVDGAEKSRPKRRVVGLGGPLSVQRHHATSAQVGLGSAKARRPTSKRRHPDGPPVGPASKVAVRSPPECKGKGGRTGTGRGGGGVAWKFAPRGGDSRNPICL